MKNPVFAKLEIFSKGVAKGSGHKLGPYRLRVFPEGKQASASLAFIRLAFALVFGMRIVISNDIDLRASKAFITLRTRHV